MKTVFLSCLLLTGCAELATTTHSSDRILQTQRNQTPTDYTYTGVVVTPAPEMLKIHVERGTNTCAVSYNETYVVDTQTDRTLSGNKAAVELGAGIPLTVIGGVLLGTANLVDPSVTLGGSSATDPTSMSGSSSGVSAQTLMYVLGSFAAVGGLVLTTVGIVNYARQDSVTTTSSPRVRTRRGENVACNVGGPAAYTPITAVANGKQYTVGATDERGNLSIKLPDVTSNLCNGEPDSLQVMAHNDIVSRVSIMPYCRNIAEEKFAAAATYEDFKAFVENYSYSPRFNEARARVAQMEKAAADRAAAEQAAQERAEAAKHAEEERIERSRQARIEAENQKAAEKLRRQEEEDRVDRKRKYLADCGDAPTPGVLKEKFNFEQINCDQPRMTEDSCWMIQCSGVRVVKYGAKIRSTCLFATKGRNVLGHTCE